MIDELYLKTIRQIMTEGHRVYDPSRSTDTIAVNGVLMKYKITESFPLVGVKFTYWKGIVHELIWMLRGDTNIKYLLENGVHIWTKDAYVHYLSKKEEPLCKNINDFELAVLNNGYLPTGKDEMATGDLGPIYGKQWRDFYGKDQLVDTIKKIIDNPLSRSHIVSAWNPPQVALMALPPCHFAFQFHCYPLNEAQKYYYRSIGYDKDYLLDISAYIRSNDMILGNPFNIAHYSLLCYLVAEITGCIPGEISVLIGNAHIYQDHLDSAREILTRTPTKSPTVKLSDSLKTLCYNARVKGEYDKLFKEMQFSDFLLEGYDHHPAVKVNMIAKNS